MTTLYLLLVLLAVAAWMTSTVSLRMKALERRAERLERRLGLVLAHLGVEEPEPAGLEQVRALLREGRTVSAIKAYREATGAGLAEAKAAVEALAELEADRA
ncbi:hypothetical protein [Streptomyces toxytricini]|uniref:Ribosomal protein L7/L12 C-terminal domain-containing protein n=1 Tax=Streptomyces toxytricini TaxID=67369 RepID=A0ABW8ELQ2_STRT5